MKATTRMRRGRLVALAALLLLSPLAVWAHDVPDFVRISVFLKPVNDRMMILVRVPANALIDFIFPLTDVGYLDLTQAESVGSQGARVWVAQMLSINENGTPLRTPDLLSVRIGRPNDPYFNSYQEALDHVNGDRMSSDILVTQDQTTVDALLQVPISSPNSNFTFTPRFARIGVVVNTTLTFLPPDGGARLFQYEGDPKPFELNPTADSAASRFVREGIAHYFSAADYFLFVLCVALAFRRLGALLPFAATLAFAECFALIAALERMPSAQWIPVVGGILVAAATVYMGIEAIIAIEGKRLGLAVASGLIFGCGFWFGLQPIVQFGGSHSLVSGLAFTAGVVLTQLLALAVLFPAVQLLLRLSWAPRAAVIIAAAIAIHVSWRLMLDRAYALTLVPMTVPSLTPNLLASVIGAAILVLTAATYLVRRRTHASAAPHSAD
jgi:hypothetical protein